MFTLKFSRCNLKTEPPRFWTQVFNNLDNNFLLIVTEHINSDLNQSFKNLHLKPTNFKKPSFNRFLCVNGQTKDNKPITAYVKTVYDKKVAPDDQKSLKAVDLLVYHLGDFPINGSLTRTKPCASPIKGDKKLEKTEDCSCLGEFIFPKIETAGAGASSAAEAEKEKVQTIANHIAGLKTFLIQS